MLIILIAATVVAAYPTPIVVPAYSQSFCENPQTQEEMNVCSARDYIAADVKMKRVWKVVVAGIRQIDRRDDVTGKKQPYFAALMESQRTWLKFRDAQCLLEGYRVRGGTAEAMNINGCMEQITKQRTEELESLLEVFGR